MRNIKYKKSRKCEILHFKKVSIFTKLCSIDRAETQEFKYTVFRTFSNVCMYVCMYDLIWSDRYPSLFKKEPEWKTHPKHIQGAHSTTLRYATGTHSFPKKLWVTANPTLVHKSDQIVFKFHPWGTNNLWYLKNNGKHAYITTALSPP